MKYSLPKENKEMLLIPSLEKMKHLAESNCRLLSQIKFGNIPFKELRADLHKQIFKEKGLVVATGHQPVIYHPGILFKEMVVNALMKRGGFLGLNLVVDSDLPKPDILIPGKRDGRLSFEKIELFGGRKDLALEEVSPPNRDRLNQKLSWIREKVKGLVHQENLETFSIYVAAANKALSSSNNLAWFLTISSRLFKERLGFNHQDVFLSTICQIPAFVYFFSLILSSPKYFASTYNRILSEYRRERRIKSSLIPFPDLRIEGNIIELPFWIWEAKKKRSTLYLRLDGEKVYLCQGLNVSQKGVDSLAKIVEEGLKGYKLRPKALMLTLFARLFLCDLWIHGVGGARYERINDRIASDFFSIALPEYAVASANLHLDFNLDTEIRGLKDRVRMMKFHPERFLRASNKETIFLLQSKRELLGKIKIKNGEDKKELSKQLRAINEKLKGKMAQEIQGIERSIFEKEKLLEIANYREYPFFLFPLADLKSLSDNLLPATY